MAQPKIVPIAGELRERVAELLGVKPGEVGIKAKTPEGLNQDHVAVAHATVLLESRWACRSPPARMVATADVEDEIDAGGERRWWAARAMCRRWGGRCLRLIRTI